MTYEDMPVLDKIRRYPLRYLGLVAAILLLIPGLFAPQNFLWLLDGEDYFRVGMQLLLRFIAYAYLIVTIIFLPLSGKRKYQIASIPFFILAAGLLMFAAFLMVTTSLVDLQGVVVLLIAGAGLLSAVLGGIVLVLVFIEQHIASPRALKLLLLLLIIGGLLEVPFILAALSELTKY